MTPTSQTPSPGRLAAIISGGVVVTFATLVLAGGAALHWVDNKKDADGYHTTSSERFATGTHALTTENFDVNDGVPGDRYGKVRLKVNSNRGKPVFVGVARTSQVDAYLGASSRATLTDIDVDPFRASYRESGLDTQPGAPGAQSIWAAKAQGNGTQTLTWDVNAKAGDWTVVVMNADGSAGVSTHMSVGANVPIVGDLATWVTIFGLVLFGGGGALVAGGLIRPRRQPSWPAESASAA